MKIDLRDPATWAALERQAYDGTVNLLPLPPPAYKYFSELTAVYRAFRFEGMPREDAEHRKELLRKAYDEQVAEIHRAREVYAEYQNAVRTAGTLTTEIEKAQSVYEIAEKACKVIGLLTGDSSFYGRQMRKITCEGVEIDSQRAHNEYDMLKDLQSDVELTTQQRATRNGHKRQSQIAKAKAADKSAELVNTFNSCAVDGRISIDDMAEMLGVSRDTVERRIKKCGELKLENGQVMRG